MPSWLCNTLKIWSRYWVIALASIPAGVVATGLINAGFSEQKAMLICVPLALLGAVALWQIGVRLNSKAIQDRHSNLEMRIQYISSAAVQPIFQTPTLDDDEYYSQDIYPRVVFLGPPSSFATFSK